MLKNNTKSQINNFLSEETNQEDHSIFQKFLASERATTVIEYAIIAAGISVVIIVAGQIFGGKVELMFHYILSNMKS